MPLYVKWYSLSTRCCCSDVKEYLIYAMETELRSLHLDPSVRGQPFAPITNLRGAVAIDYDYADKKIFFTQIKARNLSQFEIDTRNIRNIDTHENSKG